MFEGPLDLLLHLIRVNQVDIHNIPIAEITRQYLIYMSALEELDLDAAGEYVVMAATLIEIKSRIMLPKPDPIPPDEELEDPRAELVRRLVEYNNFRGIVETMREWEDLRRQMFFRGTAAAVEDYILPVPEGEVNVSQLLQALQTLLLGAGVEDKPVTSVVPTRRLTLRLKMAELVGRATAAGDVGITFEELFDLPCPRYDIVITFLALLELIRLNKIRVDQVQALAQIKIFAGPYRDPATETGSLF